MYLSVILPRYMYTKRGMVLALSPTPHTIYATKTNIFGQKWKSSYCDKLKSKLKSENEQ